MIAQYPSSTAGLPWSDSARLSSHSMQFRAPVMLCLVCSHLLSERLAVSEKLITVTPADTKRLGH